MLHVSAFWALAVLCDWELVMHRGKLGTRRILGTDWALAVHCNGHWLCTEGTDWALAVHCIGHWLCTEGTDWALAVH